MMTQRGKIRAGAAQQVARSALNLTTQHTYALVFISLNRRQPSRRGEAIIANAWNAALWRLNVRKLQLRWLSQVWVWLATGSHFLCLLSSNLMNKPKSNPIKTEHFFLNEISIYRTNEELDSCHLRRVPITHTKPNGSERSKAVMLESLTLTVYLTPGRDPVQYHYNARHNYSLQLTRS